MNVPAACSVSETREAGLARFFVAAFTPRLTRPYPEQSSSAQSELGHINTERESPLLPLRGLPLPFVGEERSVAPWPAFLAPATAGRGDLRSKSERGPNGHLLVIVDNPRGRPGSGRKISPIRSRRLCAIGPVRLARRLQRLRPPGEFVEQVCGGLIQMLELFELLGRLCTCAMSAQTICTPLRVGAICSSTASGATARSRAPRRRRHSRQSRPASCSIRYRRSRARS